MQGIDGRVAVITGAGSGIGRGAAQVFCAYGATAVLIDRNEEDLQASAADLREKGYQAYAFGGDISDQRCIEAIFARIEKDVGPIVHAFNAAGVRGVAKPVLDLTLAEWREVVDINLTGTFIAMKAQLSVMLPRGKGTIVNCSSVTGLVGGGIGSAQYSASKHGVVGLTKTAALEAIQHGVRINAIAPGLTETRMVSGGSELRMEQMRALYAPSIPAARTAQPEEIGEAVVWMCSDHAGYLVGHVMVFDGGLITGLQNVMRQIDDE